MNAVIEPIHPEIYCVSLENLADTWPKVQPWIESAVAYSQGDENLADVLGALWREKYALWTDGESMAAIVQLVKFPRQLVLTIMYAGGSLDACYRAFEFAKVFCKQRKINAIRVWGRPGWQKALGLEVIGAIMQVRV